MSATIRWISSLEEQPGSDPYQLGSRKRTSRRSSKAELEAYLRTAWINNAENYAATRGDRDAFSPMFLFVRSAKAHPSLGDLPPERALECITAVMRNWPEAMPGTRVLEGLFPESDDPYVEFIDTWHEIKWPQEELRVALSEAKSKPLSLPGSLPPRYHLFLSLAAYLQWRRRDQNIFLPCRKLADLLGCSAMMVTRYRRTAIRQGFLEKVQEGDRFARKADEFRFRCNLFDRKTRRRTRSVEKTVTQIKQALKDS